MEVIAIKMEKLSCIFSSSSSTLFLRIPSSFANRGIKFLEAYEPYKLLLFSQSILQCSKAPRGRSIISAAIISLVNILQQVWFCLRWLCSTVKSLWVFYPQYSVTWWAVKWAIAVEAKMLLIHVCECSWVREVYRPGQIFTRAFESSACAQFFIVFFRNLELYAR